MFRNSSEIKQFLRVSVWELACVAIMFCVYAFIGKLTAKVILGGVFGMIISLANFLLLTIAVTRASEKAANGGDPIKAKLAVQSSSIYRLLGIGVIYIVVLKAGVCDPIAAILPLPFVQISINLMEFFHRDGDKNK